MGDEVKPIYPSRPPNDLLHEFYETMACRELELLSDNTFQNMTIPFGRVGGWPISRSRAMILWQAEFDRRYLLRPAAYSETPNERLLRAVK